MKDFTELTKKERKKIMDNLLVSASICNQKGDVAGKNRYQALWYAAYDISIDLPQD